MSELLQVEDLHVHYPGAGKPVRAVDGVSFSLREGETFALVGESGCGKSATALSLLRLVEPGRITAGRILFDGADLMTFDERAMQRVRGGKIGMVFQEAGAALNPVMRVGSQIAETIRIHDKSKSRKEAWAEAVRLLEVVALADPERQAHGAGRHDPGPDPGAAARAARERWKLTVLLITHDLGVVAENADRVGVMYAGTAGRGSAGTGAVRHALGTPTRAGCCGRCREPGEAHQGGGGCRRCPGSVPDPAEPAAGLSLPPRCPMASSRATASRPADPRRRARRVACFLHDPPSAGGAEVRPVSAARRRWSRPRPAQVLRAPRGAGSGRSRPSSAPSTASTSTVRAGETLGLVGESGSASPRWAGC